MTNNEFRGKFHTANGTITVTHVRMGRVFFTDEDGERGCVMSVGDFKRKVANGTIARHSGHVA